MGQTGYPKKTLVQSTIQGGEADPTYSSHPSFTCACQCGDLLNADRKTTAEQKQSLQT